MRGSIFVVACCQLMSDGVDAAAAAIILSETVPLKENAGKCNPACMQTNSVPCTA